MGIRKKNKVSLALKNTLRTIEIKECVDKIKELNQNASTSVFTLVNSHTVCYITNNLIEYLIDEELSLDEALIKLKDCEKAVSIKATAYRRIKFELGCLRALLKDIGTDYEVK